MFNGKVFGALLIMAIALGLIALSEDSVIDTQTALLAGCISGTSITVGLVILLHEFKEWIKRV